MVLFGELLQAPIDFTVEAISQILVVAGYQKIKNWGLEIETKYPLSLVLFSLIPLSLLKSWDKLESNTITISREGQVKFVFLPHATLECPKWTGLQTGKVIEGVPYHL